MNSRFYPGFATDTGMLIWATRRRPRYDELVRAWSAREEVESAQIARPVAAGYRGVTLELLPTAVSRLGVS